MGFGFEFAQGLIWNKIFDFSKALYTSLFV